MTDQPDMSVVILAACGFDSLHTTLRHLRSQEASERLEIVMVTETGAPFIVDESKLEGFHGHQTVTVKSIELTAAARAAGVRAARAPIVAFAEDHSFPQPGWARALLAAHAGPWSAVGPVVLNGTPWSIWGWCDLLISYGPWIDARVAGEHPFLPGHNSSYKRDLLLAYGDRLAGMLESEMVLHQDLRTRGHRLYLEPTAQVEHVNFALPRNLLSVSFHGGWMVGAARAKHWGWPRRLLYVGGSPLIPVVRLWRIIRTMRAAQWTRMIPRMLPGLVVVLAADACGQAIGYLVGTRNVLAKVARFELYRDRRVPPQRLAEVFG